MSTGKQKQFLAQFKTANDNILKNFTATQFAEVWSKYDADGNGYIEGAELDHFLKEFVMNAGGKVVSDADLGALKKDFMDAFDENKDNKIDIAELAEILPMEENFFLLFRRENAVDSSVEFMQIWKKFDTDCSGYIETNELKEFLRFLLVKNKVDKNVTEEKLNEYTNTILTLYDANRDGKLQLSEMARLLPVKENCLARPVFKNANKISNEDIDKIFDEYDKDKNGTIENEELQGFLKDLLAVAKQEYNDDDLKFLQGVILKEWDVNHDGKISRDELRMLLMQQAPLIGKGIPLVEKK